MLLLWQNNVPMSIEVGLMMMMMMMIMIVTLLLSRSFYVLSIIKNTMDIFAINHSLPRPKTQTISCSQNSIVKLSTSAIVCDH